LEVELDEIETDVKVSVLEILQTSITKDTEEGGIEFEFNRSSVCYYIIIMDYNAGYICIN